MYTVGCLAIFLALATGGASRTPPIVMIKMSPDTRCPHGGGGGVGGKITSGLRSTALSLYVCVFENGMLMEKHDRKYNLCSTVQKSPCCVKQGSSEFTIAVRSTAAKLGIILDLLLLPLDLECCLL